MSSRITFIALSAIIALGGLACSDGQLGNERQVRFSQVVDFKETDDFGAPIALGKTVLVALQHPDHAEETYTELSFEVRDRDGGPTEHAVSMPLGFAQYAFAVFEPGHYRLVALDHGVELDWLQVRAEPMATMRLAREASVSPSDEGCGGADTTPGEVVLHPTQTATFWVVPVARSGEAMLGLLNLTADAPDIVRLDAALIGRGEPANSLRVEAGDLHDGHIEVTLREESDGHGIRFRIETEDEELRCE